LQAISDRTHVANLMAKAGTKRQFDLNALL